MTETRQTMEGYGSQNHSGHEVNRHLTITNMTKVFLKERETEIRELNWISCYNLQRNKQIIKPNKIPLRILKGLPTGPYRLRVHQNQQGSVDDAN